MALLAALLVPPSSAQESKPATPSTVPTPTSKTTSVSTAPTEKNSQGSAPAAANYSPGIQDILKLADAGVSKEVLLAFVQRSPTAYQPTPAEIIALKERGVADEVTTALLRRGAEINTQVNRRTVAMPAIVRNLSTGGQLDPESYEFWWYHYAYPRALSYSYRTLAPYDPRYRFGGFRQSPFSSRFSTPGYGWR